MLVERVSYTLLFSFMPPPLLICFFPNFWAPGWGCRPTNENSEAPTLTSYSWANGKLTPQIQTCEERKSSLLNNDNYHYNNNNASLSWCTADLLYFPGFYVLQTWKFCLKDLGFRGFLKSYLSIKTSGRKEQSGGPQMTMLFALSRCGALDLWQCV